MYTAGMNKIIAALQAATEEIAAASALQPDESPGRIHIDLQVGILRTLFARASDILVRGETCDHFDAFWKLYPRKIAKKAAVVAWQRCDGDRFHMEILRNVALRLRTEWQGKDVEFVPHASTYLNQHRWKDVPASAVPRVYDDA
jgi:hypothetical protein